MNHSVDGPLDAVARRWWLSDGSDDAFDFGWEIVTEKHELVPAWVRSLIRVGPGGCAPYIGTSVIEDLYYLSVDSTAAPSMPLKLLLSAELDRGELFGVLSGIYPEILEAIGATTVLAEELSPEQLSWLLRGDDPRRWANDGIAVTDGETVRFTPGQTEWQRLLEGQLGRVALPDSDPRDLGSGTRA